MFVGPMRIIGRGEGEKAQHIWMGENDRFVVSACGLRKKRRAVKVERGFHLGVWDARDTVPFRRCSRCAAWRKRCGKEALVAETLAGGENETVAAGRMMLDKLAAKPGEKW